MQFLHAAEVRARWSWLTIPRLYLKEWREYFALTQPQLGEKVGRSESAISRWETGKGAVSSNDLLKLAAAFRCEVPELFAPPHAPNPFERLVRILPPDDLEVAEVMAQVARLIVGLRR